MSAAAGSVLIVEDDGNACRGLAQLLQGAGFQVRTAADGVEALEALDREPPDLMLLDVWMPPRPGRDAAHAHGAAVLIDPADIPALVALVGKVRQSGRTLNA